MGKTTNSNSAEKARIDDLEAEMIAAMAEKPSVFRWIKNLFREKEQKNEVRELEELPEFKATVEPAMERLTNELIEETIGPNGALIRELQAQLAGHHPDRNPISPDKARSIMMSMLDLVVSKRKLLNERLERSVEVGELYRNYYGRVYAVTSLAAQAHTDLERMDLAEEDFRYNYGVLMNVRDKSLVHDVQPKNQLLERVLEIRVKMNTRESDIMRELDERGGG